MNPQISDKEYALRVKRTQQLMKEQEIDILLAYGNEAEPQYQRYYCDYWPSFESSGVIMAQEGDALLLIGPESMTYAKDRSRISEIRRLAAFRESSNPEYPGHKLDTFKTVIEELIGDAPVKKIGVAGYNLMPHYFYEELVESVGSKDVKVVPADDLVMKLRMVKSEEEAACLKKAGEIANHAMREAIEAIRPGMTECQLCGIIKNSLAAHGAESEAYPAWVLAGEGGNQAISRPRHKEIKEQDFVHIQLGARYEGYCATIGRPVFIGEPDPKLQKAVKAGWEGYEAIRAQLFAGNNAGNVAKAFYKTMRENGHYEWLLYGPAHATGLMEGEAPWIEDGVDFILQENMCYSICLFMGDNETGYGFRLEDTFLVGKDGAIPVTNFDKEIFYR